MRWLLPGAHMWSAMMPWGLTPLFGSVIIGMIVYLSWIFLLRNYSSHCFFQ